MKPLYLHNSLSGAKEEFQPLDPSHVRLYACGPTVYSYAHIGNARMAVVFDLLTRILRHRYRKVTYVSNITDVDDKIIAASRETGEPIAALTRRFERIYNEDMAALGCCAPDMQPRATEHIAEMIALIETLIARGHAYAAAAPEAPDQHHVLFDVPSFPGVWSPVTAQPRRHGGGGAGRGCAVQTRSRRFRAVEAEHGRPARLGQPVGPWPAGLAYRMFGDGGKASRPAFRHSWRRRGSKISAPRK